MSLGYELRLGSGKSPTSPTLPDEVFFERTIDHVEESIEFGSGTASLRCSRGAIWTRDAAGVAER